MKAIVMTDFGGPDVLKEKNIPAPEPEANELLVKVYASSVNPVDYKMRSNKGRSPLSPNIVIGWDASGVVEKTGPGVKEFKEGDEVFFTPRIADRYGTYAEYSVVDADIVAIKPKGISFIEAASLPLAGCTAVDAIVNFGKVKLGETVLIHAGAGGVGSLAIQMAKAAGAKVITTCNPGNNELVKSLGADIAIDYKKEDFIQAVQKETNEKGVDFVFDTVGGDTVSKSIEIVKPFGRIVSIVNISGDLNKAFLKNVTFGFIFMQRAKSKMELLKTLVEQRKLVPVIDSVMQLNQAADAHRKIEKGGMRGKIVLNVYST